MIDVVVAGLAVLAGIAAWSLTEYIIHRWFMHAELGPAIAARGHLDHHRHPTRRPLASPLSLVATVVVGLGVVSPAGVTVMYTCAGRLVAVPLLTWKVNASAPVKFSIGV